MKRAFTGTRYLSAGLGKVVHTYPGSERKGGEMEGEPNNMVIGDNRLQKPPDAANKRAQRFTNTGLNEFHV